MNTIEHLAHKHTPWNKGKLVGQKPSLKLHEIWSTRIRLQLANQTRDLALFNLAIDSKLRSYDLVKLRVSDISHGTQIVSRAMVMQQKTQRPVQFEITPQTRDSITDWVKLAGLTGNDYLFKSRFTGSDHISTRQYTRIIKGWVSKIGLDSAIYGTHTIERLLINSHRKNLIYSAL